MEGEPETLARRRRRPDRRGLSKLVHLRIGRAYTPRRANRFVAAAVSLMGFARDAVRDGVRVGARRRSGYT